MKQDTLEGKAKTKNGVKRLCFSIVCIFLEVIFIITIVTRFNEYAEIINLFTRILSGILVLGLYASDKTGTPLSSVIVAVIRFSRFCACLQEPGWMIEFSVLRPSTAYGSPGEEMRLNGFYKKENVTRLCF